MMSSYVSEPSTTGKVVMKTTLGPLDIELWAKETPKTCRNFVQHCLDGYYDGLPFHRIIRDLIIQGGDPTGTGTGGESIYEGGKPFPAEFHQRLHFSRRGILGMAGATPNDNRSQFFFTLGPCEELEGKHTVFGKITGESIYNLIKANDYECVDDKPLEPPKVISVEVTWNPFDDVKPRTEIIEQRKKAKEEEERRKKAIEDEKKKGKIKGKRDMKVLSFADELSSDEETFTMKPQKEQTSSRSGISQRDLDFKIQVEELMQRKKESLIVKQAQKKRSIRSHRNDIEEDDEGKEKEKKSDEAKNEDSELSTDLIQKEKEKEETTNETEDDKQENVVVDEAAKAKDFQKGMIEKMKQLRRLVDPKFREWEANAAKREAEKKERERLKMLEEEENRKKEAKMQEIFNDKRVKQRKLVLKPKFPAPPPPPSEDLNQEVFERLTKEREDRIKEIELLRLERLEERKAAARAARQVDIVARIDAFRRTLDDANKKLNRPEVKKEKDEEPKARLVRHVITEGDFDKDDDDDWRVHTFIAPKEEDDGGDNYSVEDTRQSKRRRH